jgi:hypothetical protein
MFMADNPRFSPEKFEEACNKEAEGDFR